MKCSHAALHASWRKPCYAKLCNSKPCPWRQVDVRAAF
jgi:hypothetical protein